MEHLSCCSKKRKIMKKKERSYKISCMRDYVTIDMSFGKYFLFLILSIRGARNLNDYIL